MYKSATASLDELVRIAKGKLTENSAIPKIGWLPVINTDTLRSRNKLWAEPLGSTLCQKNDVLILWDGERSGLCAFGYEGVLGSTFSRISVIDSEELDPEYLYRFLDWKFLWIQNQRTGTGVPHVPKNLGKLLQVRYPGIWYQKKIAKILSTCDEVLEKTEAAIAKYEAIKKGLMHDLFTRGIDLKTGELRPKYEDAPELYKESELGMIPKEWEVCCIKDVCMVKGGKRLPAGEEFSNSPTEFPYIRVSDMKNGSVETSDLVFVKPEIEPIIRNYKISSNDLYITIAGTLGNVGVIPQSLDQAQLTENAAKLVIADNQVDKEYLLYFFQSPLYYPQLFREIGVGGGVPKLALHRIEGMSVPRLSNKEQLIIKAKAKTVDTLIRTEKLELAKMFQIKSGLMQDLLTGNVEVKVDQEKMELDEA
jgi:type I restriction enzyme, S subunit